MSYAFRQHAGIFGIALFNGFFVYPYIKQTYRRFYSVQLQPGDPTHYAYFDIQVDGRDVGRLDFELFGKEAPKTVNNFLAFCSGDFNPYMRYKGSNILSIHEQRFIKGGDFVAGDGTGSATVYG